MGSDPHAATSGQGEGTSTSPEPAQTGSGWADRLQPLVTLNRSFDSWEDAATHTHSNTFSNAHMHVHFGEAKNKQPCGDDCPPVGAGWLALVR